MFQDVAMCFESDDGTKKLWFGRLQKLVLKQTSGSRKKVILDAVPIDNIPAGLQFRARYYTTVPRKRRTFKYGVESSCSPDVRSYCASCILHVVDFDYHLERDEYTLDLQQWRVVQQKLGNI